jgi:hypothetical protein
MPRALLCHAHFLLVLVSAFATGDAFAGARIRGQNFPADEWNWAQDNLSGLSGADWMNPLFGTQNRYRDVTGTGIQNLNELNKSKRSIMHDLGTLQPTQPGVAREGRVRSRP